MPSCRFKYRNHLRSFSPISMPVPIRKRIVERAEKKKTGIRSRSASLTAHDFHTLAHIDFTIDDIMLSCVLRGGGAGFEALPWLISLSETRRWLLLPMTVHNAVWSGGKNASIDTFEGGDDDVRAAFGYDRHQLHRVSQALQMPELIKLQGIKTGWVTSEFAFLVWLYRMKSRDTLILMQSKFAMEWSRLLKIAQAFQSWCFLTHSFRVTNALHFWAPQMRQLNGAFAALRSPPTGTYARAWSCIDATLAPLSMPSPLMFIRAREDGNIEAQIIDAEERFYCVYKHVHALKFQALSLPNGMFADVSGVVLGRRHDAALFDFSNLDDRLHQMHIMAGEPVPFVTLADSAYATTEYVKRCRGGNSEEACLMAALRASVEHVFCKVFTMFPSLKLKYQNKVFARSRIIEKMIVCCLFANINSCLEGHQVQLYFDCTAPSLEQYMSFMPID